MSVITGKQESDRNKNDNGNIVILSPLAHNGNLKRCLSQPLAQSADTQQKNKWKYIYKKYKYKYKYKHKYKYTAGKQMQIGTP